MVRKMPEGKKAKITDERPPELDLDVEGFSRDAPAWSPCPLSALPAEVIRRAQDVGIKVEGEERAGTYFQVDHSVIFRGVQRALEEKAEIISTREALQKYDWVKDYWWKIIDVDQDKYTALAELKWDQGYFIRVFEGQKVDLPLQACLFISRDNLNQNVHNLIIAEPESEVQIITGCTIHPSVRRGLHVGVTEFFVKEGAKVTFTMLHNWAQDFDARPRSAALLEEDATFVSNYVCLKPVKSLQMYPAAYCRGNNSKARFNAILYGVGNSRLDIGSKVVLEASGARGEVITRALASDGAQIYIRGLLVGERGGTKAHLECRGLLLSDDALIHAIPELIAKAEGAELSHEAAVGKIAEDQIRYLMARGFSEEEAQSLIVRGFMDVRILGLPPALESEIRKMIEITTKRAL